MSTFPTRWGNLAISTVRRRMALNVGNKVPASTFSSQLISQRWIGIVACLKAQLEPIEKKQQPLSKLELLQDAGK